MSAESPDKVLESITRDIERLTRQSRSVIPVAVIGLIIILAGVIYSVLHLLDVQSKVERKTQELKTLEYIATAKQAQIDEKERKLEDLGRKTEILSQAVSDLPQAIKGAASAPNTARKQAELNSALARAETVKKSLAETSTLLAKETGPARYGNYLVDLFYCGDRAERNKPLAESAGALGQGGTTRGRWRVRELTPKANASSGYNIRSDLIRFNSDEKPIAGKLQKDIAEHTGVSLSNQEIAYPTPGYISIFFCAEA